MAVRLALSALAWVAGFGLGELLNVIRWGI